MKAEEVAPVAKPYEPKGLVLPESLSDRLQLTQHIRCMVLDEMTEGGTQIPATDDGIKLLLEVSRNMDAATLGEMKAKTDAVNADNGVLVASVIQQLSQTRGAALTFEAPTARRIIPPSPELDAAIDLVPDETHIGLQSLTYEDMKGRLGKA